jgi:glycosyltransferase involved in cell wall biosynthesis
MHWITLDTGSVWLKEFAAALGTMVPTRNWCPEMHYFGWRQDWERTEEVEDPPISVIRFPLQRGYARFPVAQMVPFQEPLVERLIRFTQQPEESTLICTSPFYAPVAELWPWRVVYYLTDLTKEYAGVNPAQVVKFDRRMCRVAHSVCPNSHRIADYLCAEAGCDRKKITVIPNATREENVLDQPAITAFEPPADLSDLPRPILGVIGNFASNMDWTLLADAVKKTKNVSWAFIGPTEMPVPERVPRQLRRELMKHGGRVRFLGARPYGMLSQYARAFDVAVIPYEKTEPTISGSATRFYEHLAACRPILASRAHAELLTKEPLLKLVDTGEDVAAEVECLRGNGFRDGFEEQRWKASQEGTWKVRARDLMAATLRNRSLVALA